MQQSQEEHSATSITVDVAVVGAGPGGYTAAFRAADLGKSVVLIERYPNLGGVCLNVGCIPSKTLLHAAALINDAVDARQMGINFSRPVIDLAVLRANKDKVIKRLTQGLVTLAKQRKIRVLHGNGTFITPNRLMVAGTNGQFAVTFSTAIIACGSSVTKIPTLPYDDSRLMDSTAAVALTDIPRRLLVMGGGIIGLEMATVYQVLGSQVDIVELQPQLLPGCDLDLVKVLLQRLGKSRNNGDVGVGHISNIMTSTRVESVTSQPDGLWVHFTGTQAPPESVCYDKILVAVGRVPNGHNIGAAQAGVHVDEHGFIPVDHKLRTNIPHIYAVGDVVGQPMLAHKAIHQAKVAAEVIAGLTATFDPLAIPSVAYTDPEIAWMGFSENAAKAQGRDYIKGVFPWLANGRAIGINRDEGLTKLLFDPKNRRIIGAGIVGKNAGELISEAVFALEMGACAEDLSLTVHPHPTLSETLGLAAEVALGAATDLPPPRHKKPSNT